MSKRSAPPKPTNFKWGLRLAWLTLFASILFALWTTISGPLSGVASERNPASIGTVLLLSAAMLLTPAFAGYWTGALMLALAARRIRWARWVLLIGVVLAAALFVFNAFTSHASGRIIDMPFIYVRLGLLLANAVAIGLMFTEESSVWFHGNVVEQGKDAP